jgi:hypothetical protein
VTGVTAVTAVTGQPGDAEDEVAGYAALLAAQDAEDMAVRTAIRARAASGPSLRPPPPEGAQSGHDEP